MPQPYPVSAEQVRVEKMPSPTSTPVALHRDGHIAGLDGLRAIAVGLVLVYHLFPGLLQGGFIGVDVFFVISGFLITTLLLREHAKTGRIALGSFWRRRARRLLPAIVLVVLTCGALAAIVGGDTLVDIGRQVLGSLTFSYNWLSIASGSSYFDQTAPELFRNFWSLAVEEQFYIVWPLLFIVCMVAGGRAVTRERTPKVDGRLVLGLASLVIGVASVAWMLVLYPGTGDATRVYFGTDTHAFGLVMGSALACSLFNAPVLKGARTRASIAALGIVSVVTLVVLSAIIDDYQSWTYPWGLLLASTASAGVILAVMLWPRLGKLLDSEPLRWIGVRSYGIYLWHWPFVVLTAEALRGSLATPLIGMLVLGGTLVVAHISHRWIEQPFRQHGFRVIARHTRLSWVGASRSRRRTMLLTAYGLITALLLGTGIINDPGVTQSARGISDGQDHLSTQEPPDP
ncbi:MAG TPA: acyltransferase, partial [Candidatus Agrococcus pullicola]|nr:acyltransferase [Candidatus Agrococcus pullicola]